MHRKMCIISAVVFLTISTILTGQTDSRNSLTIETAVSKALENNPTLKVLIKEISALEAVKIQSGLMPNPELSVDAENLFGKGDFVGFNGSEITAQVSQSIMLAGKISKLEKVAEMNVSLAEWDYEANRLIIITNVRKAFNQALVVQQLIKKNKELIKLSEDLLENINMRVKAGKISLAEVSRTKIIINSLQIALTKLQYEYEAAIMELKTLIYDPTFSFTELKGSFKYYFELPPYDTLLVQLESNPNLKRYESEYAKQKAVLSYEESKATPDLTLSAGYKRLNEISANTFVLGASIPLPLFNRNQGSIQEAEIRYDQKKVEFESTRNRLTLRLNLLYNRLNTLLKTANQLKTESIPETEKAFKIIKEGNLVGRFAILDVLDTQRTLFELQNQYLIVIGEIQSVKAELEGLISKEIK
ncbi:MAG: TolC family protein [Chlorobi bacterium]|nr:TolC family protein [Chlorobiota bacterium]